MEAPPGVSMRRSPATVIARTPSATAMPTIVAPARSVVSPSWMAAPAAFYAGNSIDPDQVGIQEPSLHQTQNGPPCTNSK